MISVANKEAFSKDKGQENREDCYVHR